MTAPPVWVTGAAGFLGTQVVGRLLAQGHDVCCLVRTRASAETLSASLNSNESARLKFVFGSLNNIDSCRELVSHGRIGYHIASSLAGSAAALFTTNVIATRTLLKAVREGGCQRFVLVSSIAVYGTYHLAKHAVLDESCGLDPSPHLRDPYTFSKVAQEQVCWTARADWGLPLVVVRPGMIYGPGRECLTARVGLRVGALFVRMGGRQALPYTYIENCADAVVKAGLTDGIEGEAFNILDDELPNGRQLINEQRRRVGPVRTLAIPLWALKPLSRYYTAYARYSKGQLPAILTPYRVSASWNSLGYSNVKARTRLGWTCAVDLAKGLQMTFDSLTQTRKSR